MNKVRPGQPLKISAADWNAIVDVVNDAQRDREPLLSAAIASGVSNAIIRGFNISGETIPAFTAVEIMNYFPNLDYSTEGTPALTLQFSMIKPAMGNGAPYAITQEEIPPTHCGRCMVYGITSALFKTLEPIEAGAYADPAPDAPGRLAIGSSGMARVLSAPSSTASDYTTILLGCGGGGGTVAEVGPQPWELRVGTMDQNGETVATVEVYLPFSVVARYCDDPQLVNLASANLPLALQSRTLASADSGWHVWRTFKSSDPDITLGYLFAEMTPSGWAPSVVGSSFEPAIVLTSEDDGGETMHDESAEGTRTPLAPANPRARALVGMIRKEGAAVQVLSNTPGEIRFSFVVGEQALYVQPAPSSSTPEDPGEIEITRTPDAFNATTLPEGATLLWCAVPMGAVFRTGGLDSVYAIDFSTTKKRYIPYSREAVVHAMLHYANFINQ